MAIDTNVNRPNDGEVANKYYVTCQQVRIFEVYASSPERAVEMCQRKEYRPVGTPTHEGWSELRYIPPVESWSATPAPLDKHNGGNS